VKYLSQNPGDARALFDLGYIEDAGNHQDAAAADYRKAMVANPKQFEAPLALGLLLAIRANTTKPGNRFSRRPCSRPSRPAPLPRRRLSGRWPSWIAPAIRQLPGMPWSLR